MTDWKEAARKHEASADGYARLYYDAKLANAELADVLEFVMSELSDMTTNEFAVGADKQARERMAEAIRKHKENNDE